MKLWIGLVTPDEVLQKYFGEKKAGIVPSGTINKGYFSSRTVKIFTNTYTPTGVQSDADFCRFVCTEAKEADLCLVLVDRRSARLVEMCRLACFVVPFDAPPLGSNRQNFFHSLVAGAMRMFGQIAAKFESGSDTVLLSLPFRNFHAAELTEIARLISDESLSPTLSNRVDSELATLRRRVRPRRQSSYKTQYAVDDRKRFFVYGHEHHSRPETGGDHGIQCRITAEFRFGKRIDFTRHYNVSETEGDKTTIDGVFMNCHGIAQSESRDTHLNMFSNDMYY